jgi:hypothetical protein
MTYFWDMDETLSVKDAYFNPFLGRKGLFQNLDAIHSTGIEELEKNIQTRLDEECKFLLNDF